MVMLGGFVVNGTINVVVSIVMALATGQEFTVMDGIMAFFTGGVGFFDMGNYFSGILAFTYTMGSAYEEGASIYAAFFSGLISGVLTAFSFGSFAKFGEEEKVARIVTNIIWDVSNAFINTISSIILTNKNKSSSVKQNYSSTLSRKQTTHQNIFKNRFESRYGFC